MAIIKSGATSDQLTIDPTSKAARATLYDTSGNSIVQAEDATASTYRGLPVMGLNDKSVLPMRLDRLGSVASALHTIQFHDSFEGTTINPNRWLSTATTMAATQSSVAGITINSGAITTINTGYMLQSTRRFIKSQRTPLQAKYRIRAARVNNSVMEWGFADASAFNTANTTGAYWQVTAAGVIQPVLTFNSVDVTGSDISGSIDVTKYYTYDIFLDDDEAIFTVQDTSTGNLISKQSIKLSLTAQRLWSSTQVGLQVRLYNTGVAPASAPQLFLTDAVVTALDANQAKPWSHIVSTIGRNSIEHPFTGGQTGAFTNSAFPTAFALSNTVAGGTTLGGLFQFAAPAGATTDYCFFGYQVPTPANLVITGIDIEAWNTGAAVATTPTLLMWGLATQLTAVSLATANHVRTPLGAQSFPVGAAIGAKAERITCDYTESPIICNANRFVVVILRIPVGTATASQVIQGLVNIKAYFD